MLFRSIVAFLDGLLSHWQGIVHTVHHGRVHFDEADATTATGWWVVSEEGVLDGDGVRFTGLYHDRYTNADGDGWRFSHRRYDGLLTTRAGTTTVRPWPADVR